MARIPQAPLSVIRKGRQVPRRVAPLLEAAMGIALSEHPLAWITQWGARLMLQVALEEEVVAFLERDWYARRPTGGPSGWRNGSKPRPFPAAAALHHEAEGV
ncbi:MAG: hypothetical protein ACK4Z6_02305 [Candidatus Methylomirabilales bacterium]